MYCIVMYTHCLMHCYEFTGHFCGETLVPTACHLLQHTCWAQCSHCKGLLHVCTVHQLMQHLHVKHPYSACPKSGSIWDSQSTILAQTLWVDVCLEKPPLPPESTLHICLRKQGVGLQAQARARFSRQHIAQDALCGQRQTRLPKRIVLKSLQSLCRNVQAITNALYKVQTNRAVPLFFPVTRCLRCSYAEHPTTTWAFTQHLVNLR